MKKLIIYLALLVAFITWFGDWISSGKMDNFIGQHRHPTATPKIIYAIGQSYYLFQQHKQASFYFRWLIEEYPAQPQIPETRWRISQCYEELKRKDLAMEQYVVLKDSFTNTEYGRLALQRYEHLRLQ